MLSYSKAVYWQVIKENVAERVENVKVPHKERAFLEIEDIKEVLLLLEKEPV